MMNEYIFHIMSSNYSIKAESLYIAQMSFITQLTSDVPVVHKNVGGDNIIFYPSDLLETINDLTKEQIIQIRTAIDTIKQLC